MDRDADTALEKIFKITPRCVFRLPFVAVKVLLFLVYFFGIFSTVGDFSQILKTAPTIVFETSTTNA